MATKAFFLFNLKPGVSVEDYARWSLAVNHPFARSVKEIKRFHDHRAVGTLEGEPAYQIIEEIEIESVEAYKAAMERPEFKAFGEQWSQWVSDWIVIFTEPIG